MHGTHLVGLLLLVFGGALLGEPLLLFGALALPLLASLLRSRNHSHT